MLNTKIKIFFIDKKYTQRAYFCSRIYLSVFYARNMRNKIFYAKNYFLNHNSACLYYKSNIMG